MKTKVRIQIEFETSFDVYPEVSKERIIKQLTSFIKEGTDNTFRYMPYYYEVAEDGLMTTLECGTTKAKNIQVRIK